MTDKSKIEGEGSYTATRDYNKRTNDFLAREGDQIEDMAEDAADALEGNEGEALRKAEQKGKKPARH